jgi:hypothetical protein
MELDDELSFACQNCTQLAINPLGCSECEKLVCAQCLPLLSQCKECGKGQFEANGFAKKWINRLRVPCRVNCTQFMRADDLLLHEASCEPHVPTTNSDTSLWKCWVCSNILPVDQKCDDCQVSLTDFDGDFTQVLTSF